MSEGNKFTLVGHRGFPAQYPENSLQGIKAALELGITAIEIDIQMSRDTIPVVTHDYSLSRLAQKAGMVSEYTYSELKKMSVHEPDRFGENFYPTPITSLAEVVQLIKKHSAAVLFAEIKKDIFMTVNREQALKIIWDELELIKGQSTIISYDLSVLRLVQGQALCPVGWVLTQYADEEYDKIKNNPVDVVICNKNKFPVHDEALWIGPWDWFSYDIMDSVALSECLSRGVSWIETRDAKGLLDIVIERSAIE